MLAKPLSPNFLKGAFIAFYPDSQLTKVITFQLNPDALQRKILPLETKGSVFKTAGVRERISCDLSVDAMLGDGYFDQGGEVVSHGVAGFLSALELLLHPAEISNESSASSVGANFFGIFDFITSLFGGRRRKAVPMVSLVFGTHRIIPIKIRSIRVIEQAFDARLNPVRASVHIVMETLTKRESKYYRHTEEIYNNYIQHKVDTANSLIN